MSQCYNPRIPRHCEDNQKVLNYLHCTTARLFHRYPHRWGGGGTNDWCTIRMSNGFIQISTDILYFVGPDLDQNRFDTQENVLTCLKNCCWLVFKASNQTNRILCERFFLTFSLIEFRITYRVNVLKFQTLVACQKMPRQRVQIMIRLLLKKQSDQDLPCLLFWNPALTTNTFFENRTRKVPYLRTFNEELLLISSNGFSSY